MTSTADRRPELIVWPGSEWAGAVAGRLAERLRRLPSMRLCLPTGDTPSPVYQRLVELNRAGEAPFDRSTVLLLDEYVGLPPDDPARCDARLRRELIDLLKSGPAAFHSIRVDDLSAEAAAEAHDAVAARGLDLALLGLGTNGHVGLNEPGSSVDSATHVVELAAASRASARQRYGASATPTHGVTLGLGRLLAADEIWLLVTGERKASVLRRAIEGPQMGDLPASLLRRHGRLVVLADEAAAAVLC